MLTPSLPLEAHNLPPSGCSHHPSLKQIALPTSAFPSSHPMARTFLDCSQHLSLMRHLLREPDRASPSGTLAPQGSAGAGTRPAHAGRKVPQAPHRPEPLEPLVASPSWLPPRHEIPAEVPPCCSPLGDENGVQLPWAAQICPKLPQSQARRVGRPGASSYSRHGRRVWWLWNLRPGRTTRRPHLLLSPPTPGQRAQSPNPGESPRQPHRARRNPHHGRGLGTPDAHVQLSSSTTPGYPQLRIPHGWSRRPWDRPSLGHQNSESVSSGIHYELIPTQYRGVTRPHLDSTQTRDHLPTGRGRATPVPHAWNAKFFPSDYLLPRPKAGTDRWPGPVPTRTAGQVATPRLDRGTPKSPLDFHLDTSSFPFDGNTHALTRPHGTPPIALTRMCARPRQARNTALTGRRHDPHNPVDRRTGFTPTGPPGLLHVQAHVQAPKWPNDSEDPMPDSDFPAGPGPDTSDRRQCNLPRAKPKHPPARSQVI